MNTATKARLSPVTDIGLVIIVTAVTAVTPVTEVQG